MCTERTRTPAMFQTAAIAALVLVAACAPKVVPPPSLPSVLKYPELMFPAVPAGLQQTPGAERIDVGWRYLQNGDLAAAEREFATVLKRTPTFAPAKTGEGYVALVRERYEQAISAFDAALAAAPQYVPALVARGQSLLALNRNAEALEAFEAAVAVDDSLADLRRRIAVLRFRSLQEVIDAARTSAAAERLDDARTAYRSALESSPESAFLHRELGIVERRRGDADSAAASFRRAVELDPSDSASWTQIGELLEARQDFAGAEAAYRRASEIEPTETLSARLAALAARAREAKLPPEFRAIPEAPQISRGELAALIGIRLEDLLRTAPVTQVVLTDTQGHWASPWITTVARAGVVEPFENHTFQPRSRVRRGDLAMAVSRVVTLLAAGNPSLRPYLTVRPKIADMNPGHLSYPAVSVAVASGVMPLLEGQRFQVSRAVTGAEAVATIDRLRGLAGQSR